ncbi:MAG: hypothetical protein LBG91_02720 [Treponema sp.]|nr:hypothetical protein [Treponema sp.]
MNRSTWNKFIKARERFRLVVAEIGSALPRLMKIQQQLVDSRSVVKTAAYTVETPVVYNSALDDVSIGDEIKLILVADNPGRREQAAENRRYLTGLSGKIAEKFFCDNPALEIDFRKNVIILNKTPIHSPRTVELRELCRLDTDGSLAAVLKESQRTMTSLLFEFYNALNARIWITGYSEMKRGGIFEVYTETLKTLCATSGQINKNILFFRHFSMNQFTIDLKKQSLPGETTAESLYRIGTAYRQRILGI